MKTIFIGVILLQATLLLSAQTRINLSDASTHIGDSVQVCGKVYGIKFLESSTGGPTLINMGAAFPDQLLALVIRKETRANFDKTPEELFAGKEICVNGKIETYKGKPQIVVHNTEQVIVK